MKRILIGAVILGFGLSPAFASDESYDHCTAFADANGLDPAPCSCIAENIGDDADLLAEQAALKTEEDIGNASAELQDAINACVPA